MKRRFVPLSRAVFLAAFTLLASSPVLAQTPVPSAIVGAAEPVLLGSPAFAAAVRGKTVWITTSNGIRSKARVVALSSTGLTVDRRRSPLGRAWAGGPGPGPSVSFDQIVTVQHVTHRLRNGFLIGLVSGLGAGVVQLFALGCGDESNCTTEQVMGLSIAIGAGAGLGLGALLNATNRDNDLIYDARRRTTTIALAPILSPTRKGLAFSMTWR